MTSPQSPRHGHVTPKEHGLKARCGGPAICSICAKEAKEAYNMTSPKHGIDPAQLKFICLAGSVREYYDWMRKHQVREGESLYASTPTILQGLSTTDYDITFHQIGTFEERKDAL